MDPGCWQVDPLAQYRRRECAVGLGHCRVQAGEHQSLRRVARTLGAGVAGVLLVAGTITALGAGAAVGPPAASADLSCNDTWTGAAATTDWNTAANWSAGVPQSTSVHACITGDATVVVSGASFAIGALTVSAGSSLTIGGNGPGATAASLSVSSGLENDGTLTAGPSGATGEAALTLDGPITNTGALMVDGTVTMGDTTSTGLVNDGSLAVAPGGLIDMGASSTLTNSPDGILVFGIDGPPSSTSDYGRVTNGTLSLAGSGDPVFDDGFTPAPGSEYFVDTGASSGTFTTVLHDATADYSHPGRLGLTGGAPATATSTTLTSSVPAGSRAGQGVQFTAAVVPSPGASSGSSSGASAAASSGSSPGAGPTGSVTFSAGGLLLGRSPVTTAASGTSATLDVSDLPVGSDSVTAAYSGDVDFDPSTSPVVTQVVSPDPDPTNVAVTPSSADPAASTGSPLLTLAQVPTQTTVASSTPSSTYGQSVTVTATVVPAQSGPVSPTGTVTFYDYETTPIATVGVSTVAGVTTATLDTSGLMSGPHAITASYSGDPTFGSSSSAAPALLTVAEAATTVALAGSTATSVVGQAVVFTVTISSSASGETGTVQFDDDGSMIGSGTVSGGQATFQTSSLALGAHPVTAVYEGDDDFVGSSSANTLELTVSPASTATTLTSSDDPGAVGQTITFAATVTVDGPGSGTPTGTVSFSDGASPIDTCQSLALPPIPPLRVTCSQVYGTAASHSVVATYGGDADDITSTGGQVETVAPVSTTTSLVSSPLTSTYGQSVTLTATVAPTSGAANPNGTVTFTDNGTTLGSSTLTTTAGVTTASMLSTTLPVGSDVVVASFDGGADFLASSTTTAVRVAVARAPTSLGLLTSTNPSTSTQPVTLTAIVFPATGSGETGTVTFFDDGDPIGTSSVSNSQATLSTTALPVGADLITASYSGDGDFAGSPTAGALSQTVDDRRSA